MTTDATGQTIEERVYRRLQRGEAFVSELRTELQLLPRTIDRALLRLKKRGLVNRSFAGWSCTDASTPFPRPDYFASGQAGAKARWGCADTRARSHDDP